jgi:hypothetical protein
LAMASARATATVASLLAVDDGGRHGDLCPFPFHMATARLWWLGAVTIFGRAADITAAVRDAKAAIGPAGRSLAVHSVPGPLRLAGGCFMVPGCGTPGRPW